MRLSRDANRWLPSLALMMCLAIIASPMAVAQDYLPQPQGRSSPPPTGPQLTWIERAGETLVPYVAPPHGASTEFRESTQGVEPPVLQRLPATPARPLVPLQMQAVEHPASLPAPPLPQPPGAPVVDRSLPFMMQQAPGNAPSASTQTRPPTRVSTTAAAAPAIPAPTFAPEAVAAPRLPPQTQPPLQPRVAGTPMTRMPAAASPAWLSAPLPASTMPVVAGGGDFVIGVADVLSVTVVGEPELSLEADVSPAGEVNLPLVGGLQVAGLTPSVAAQRVQAAYVDGQYLLAPQVQVRVLESRNLMISVLGEVRQPGRFAAPVQMSVLDALALAGGIADTGDHRVTVLREEGGRLQRREIDLTGLANGVDLTGSAALMLRPGDTVMVPEAARFYIYGEVRSPNAYPLKPGMTVMQALALGGGANDRGSRKRIEIQRQTASGEVQSRSASLADPVQPNDVIYIRERLF